MSFISEVQEHPSALRAMLDHCNRQEEREGLVTFLNKIKPRRVVFSGMGSSFFSSQIAALYLRRGGFDAAAIESGELCDAEFLSIDRADLVIAISQTGGSKELVRVCEKINGRKPIIAVTNRHESRIGQFGDYVFTLCAGQEQFTSSKTYTNTLGAIFVLCDAILESAGLCGGTFHDRLYECADWMQSVLDGDGYLAAARELAQLETYTMIGSGFSNMTACHSVLIAAEAAKIFASHFTLGQYAHGPIEMINEKYAYFVFDSDPAFTRAAGYVMETILRLGGHVFRVGSLPRKIVHEHYHQFLIPQCAPELAPMLEVIVMELIINEVGLAKGVTPGALTIVQK